MDVRLKAAKRSSFHALRGLDAVASVMPSETGETVAELAHIENAITVALSQLSYAHTQITSLSKE